MSNSTPTEITNIRLAETGTIVSVKLDLIGWGSSGAVGDITEMRLFLFCRAPVAGSPMPDPATTQVTGGITEFPEIDALNGFYVGSLFFKNVGLLNGEGLTDRISTKFHFKRKFDRNDELILSGEIIPRAGAVVIGNVAGGIMAVIKTR